MCALCDRERREKDRQKETERQKQREIERESKYTLPGVVYFFWNKI